MQMHPRAADGRYLINNEQTDGEAESAKLSESGHRSDSVRPPHSPYFLRFDFGLIGRREELRNLMHGLDEAFGGHAWSYCITGEPGVGKTRLVSEFGALARERGAQVVWGRCSNFETPPYWPWIQVMRALAASGPNGHMDDAEMLVRLLESGRNYNPSERFKLFDRVADCCRRAAAPQPLVLIIDDLGAADESSLLLLGFITRELSDVGVQILVIDRDSVYLPQPGRELRHQLVFHVMRHISLHPLSHAEVKQLLAETTGREVPDTMVETVYTHAGGNPLIIETIFGNSTFDWQHGSVRKNAKAFGPVLERVLSPLSRVARELLDLASLVGPEFDFQLILPASELPPDQALDGLAELEAAGVVRRVDPLQSRYRFVHQFVRDTLPSTLRAATKARLHARLAETLEAMYENGTDVDLAALARHFFESAALGCAAKALKYGQLAADDASRRHLYAQAASLYRVALGALELCATDDSVRRNDLLLAIAASQSKSGNSAAAQTLHSLPGSSASDDTAESASQVEESLTDRVIADISAPAPTPESAAERQAKNAGFQTESLAANGRALFAGWGKDSSSASPARSNGSKGATGGSTGHVAVAPNERIFRREGEYWTIAYESKVFRLKHSKGMAHIAQLIANPGREFHAAELDTLGWYPARANWLTGAHEIVARASGDAAPQLDSAAKSSYRLRLHQLRDELEEAHSCEDSRRAAAIENEIEFLSRELARAIGLGGRDRELGSEIERARLRVTNAIRSALKRIARQHSGLGRYFSNSLHTGNFCSFEPGNGTSMPWQL